MKDGCEWDKAGFCVFNATTSDPPHYQTYSIRWFVWKGTALGDVKRLPWNWEFV